MRVDFPFLLFFCLIFFYFFFLLQQKETSTAFHIVDGELVVGWSADLLRQFREGFEQGVGRVETDASHRGPQYTSRLDLVGIRSKSPARPGDHTGSSIGTMPSTVSTPVTFTTPVRLMVGAVMLIAVSPNRLMVIDI